MRRVGLGLAALALICVSGAASATDDAKKTREVLMESNGASAGVGAAMLKEEIPYSPAAANAIFRNFRAVGYAFGDYFPEGSQEGSKASPKIWEDMAGFQAALEKFRTDSETAMAAKPQDLAAFKTAFGAVTANCQSCHETYRLP